MSEVENKTIPWLQKPFMGTPALSYTVVVVDKSNIKEFLSKHGLTLSEKQQVLLDDPEKLTDFIAMFDTTPEKNLVWVLLSPKISEDCSVVYIRICEEHRLSDCRSLDSVMVSLYTGGRW